MRELHAAISDPNLLLALEPEELGAQILLLLRERRERTFSLAGILHDLRQMNDHGDTGYEMWPTRLTMAGHEYLDTIRDEEVWRRTKEGARAMGSFSLDALGALAKGLVREKIRKHTGIEVDL